MSNALTDVAILTALAGCCRLHPNSGRLMWKENGGEERGLGYKSEKSGESGAEGAHGVGLGLNTAGNAFG